MQKESKLFFSFPSSSLLSRHGPAIKHGYPIQSIRATFLDTHRGTQLHPAGWLIRGDTQGLIGTDAREPAHLPYKIVGGFSTKPYLQYIADAIPLTLTSEEEPRTLQFAPQYYEAFLIIFYTNHIRSFFEHESH